MKPEKLLPEMSLTKPDSVDIDEVIETRLVRSILDSSPDCIKLLALDGSLIYMNRNGMCAMEIDSFCDVDGKAWPTLWPAEAQEMLRAAMEDATLGKRSEFEAFCPTAKGQARWWNVDVTPVFDDNKKVRHLLGTSRDITRRVTSDNSLRERDIQLQAYAEQIAHELHEKEALLEQQLILTAEIDHRVKNSFSLIGSVLRLKMREMADGEAKEALADAVNRIATLSRVHEQLHTDVAAQSVALNPFFSKLIGDLASTLADQSELKLVEAVECTVSSEAAIGLGLVASELVSNALKHKMVDKAAVIRVSLIHDAGAETIQLVVADNGAGLPDGFDLNGQTGLGMQICKIYGSKLKGTFEAMNGPQGGAVFMLTFPMVEADFRSQ